MKGLVFSKSLIEIADRDMPPSANKFPIFSNASYGQIFKFCQSLSYSELERVSKSHIPKFSKITITLSTVMSVLTQSKMCRILL